MFVCLHSDPRSHSSRVYSPRFLRSLARPRFTRTLARVSMFVCPRFARTLLGLLARVSMYYVTRTLLGLLASLFPSRTRRQQAKR